MAEGCYEINKELETLSVVLKFFLHKGGYPKKIYYILFLSKSKLSLLVDEFLLPSVLNIPYLRSNGWIFMQSVSQVYVDFVATRSQKSKDQWKSSYKCEDYRDMLREKFDLDTEKDDETIHPLRFCNAC